LVLKTDDARLEWAKELRAAKLDVIGVVTPESVQDFTSVENAALYYVSKYQGVLTHLQLGNEPDLESDSSSSMTPLELLRFSYEFMGGWGPRHNLVILGAGLASGQPSWLDPVKPDYLRLVNRLAIHAYGQRPNSSFPAPDWGFGVIVNLIRAYQSYGLGTLPVVSEWGANINDYDDESQRAEYISLMLGAFRQLNTDALLFCLGPNMVPEFDLISADGTPTESYAAFADSFVLKPRA
jgi:hypothetical protein